MISKESSYLSFKRKWDLPEDWKVVPFKTYYSTNKGLSITKANLVEKGIPVISYGQIHSKTGTFFKADGLPFVDESYLNNTSAILVKGDVAFADTSEDIEGSGNISVMDSDATILAGYHVIVAKPKKLINYRYAGYMFESFSYRSQIQSKVQGIKVYSITQKIILNTKIWIPPIEVQEKIATAIDKDVTIIDDILVKTQHSIEQLKQYKKSLITEVVTKGINPNIEFQQSKIGWAEQVPKHWKVRRLKELFHEIDERNLDENATLLSLFTAIGVKPRKEMEQRGNKAVTVIDYKKVEVDDVVVNKLLAWMGAIGYSDYVGVTSPDYDVYRKRENANVSRRYYNYYFRDTDFKSDCFKVGRGIMMMRWRTYPEQFLSILVANPPLEEQEEIADYLDKKVVEIDRLIESKTKIIMELKNYKKYLIFEYVTGRKMVE
jgi:type I restriction enzyme S subunit